MLVILKNILILECYVLLRVTEIVIVILNLSTVLSKDAPSCSGSTIVFMIEISPLPLRIMNNFQGIKKCVKMFAGSRFYYFWNCRQHY